MQLQKSEGSTYTEPAFPRNKDGPLLRAVLLGRTGVGKSATGNTLLGSGRFETGSSFDTSTITSSLQTGKYNGVDLKVVDTPGLADPGDCMPALKEIVRGFSLVPPGPHAIVLVLSVASRFTEEEYNAYRALKHLFGDEIKRHVILVFTHGDCLAEEETAFSTLVETAPPQLVQILEECKFRYVIFDNTRPDTQQVDRAIGLAKQLSHQYGYFSTPMTLLTDTQLKKELKTRLKQAQEQETRREKTVLELQKLRDEIQGTIRNLDDMRDRQQRLIQELLEEEDLEIRRSEAVKRVQEDTGSCMHLPGGLQAV